MPDINMSQSAQAVYGVDPATGSPTPTGSSASPSQTQARGAGSIATNQVTLTTGATLIVAARAGRQSVTITSTAATVFYVGPAGVTTATGLYVAAAAGASVTINTSAAVFGVVATGTLLVSYMETF